MKTAILALMLSLASVSITCEPAVASNENTCLVADCSA
jgi:hypothetical protein